MKSAGTWKRYLNAGNEFKRILPDQVISVLTADNGQAKIVTPVPPQQATITAYSDVGGTIAPGGVFSAVYGVDQTFTASPSTNYVVNQWLVDGVVVQTGGNSFILTHIQVDHTVEVTFASTLPRFTITASAGVSGSIAPTGDSTVTSGDDLIFTATPGVNYVVNQWLVDGVVVQTGGSSYTLSNIQSNHTVEVTFALTTVFSFGGVVATHPNGTVTLYPALTNTDLARGNALMSAVGAAIANDHIDMSNGVFDVGDVGNGQINMGVSGGCFHIHGNNKTQTTIRATSSAVTEVVLIKAYSNSQTTDLTLLCDDPNALMAAWGYKDLVGSNSIADTWLYNVSIDTQVDGILFATVPPPPSTSHLTATLVNVSILSRIAGAVFGTLDSASVVNCYSCDCVATSDEAQPTSYGEAFCWRNSGGGILTLYGCSGIATDASDVDNFAYAVHLTTPGGTLHPTTNLYGGTFRAYNLGGPPVVPTETDLVQNTVSLGAHIKVSPSVQWSTFRDVIVPNQVPGNISDISWTAPNLPPRPYPKPIITNLASP